MTLVASHAGCRNRTQEFFSVVDSARSRRTTLPAISTSAVRHQQQQQMVLSRTEFARLASGISRGIAGTAAKLDKLTKRTHNWEKYY